MLAFLLFSPLLPGASDARTPPDAAAAPQAAPAAAAAARFVNAPASLVLLGSGGALAASQALGRHLERGLKDGLTRDVKSIAENGLQGGLKSLGGGVGSGVLGAGALLAAALVATGGGGGGGGANRKK